MLKERSFKLETNKSKLYYLSWINWIFMIYQCLPLLQVGCIVLLYPCNVNNPLFSNPTNQVIFHNLFYHNTKIVKYKNKS